MTMILMTTMIIMMMNDYRSDVAAVIVLMLLLLLLSLSWRLLPFSVLSVTRIVSCHLPLAASPSPSQAFVVKRLLEYTQQGVPDLPYGLLLVLGLLTTELVRSWSLALTWALNYRTGSRLRGAILTMAFHKILRLRSIREKSMGEVRAERWRDGWMDLEVW